VTGALVDCGIADTPTACGTVSPGFVALIARGSIAFADKVRNAMAQGAAAAIVYNNAPGLFSGTLGSPGDWIPAVAVSPETGATLKNAVGQPATVTSIPSDWDVFDGTSMAAPHVSGVAALIYAIRPSATPAQVEAIMKGTATDLGTAGADSTYGAGLVNAAAAVARARQP
jgi:subtilisin family serine protease